MNVWLRVLIFIAVAVALSLYLYDAGAHRVFDIVISAVVMVCMSLVLCVLAAASKAKCGRVFDRADDKLVFAFPDNALKKLPFFFLVFIGKANILPATLGKKKQPPATDTDI